MNDDVLPVPPDFGRGHADICCCTECCLARIDVEAKFLDKIVITKRGSIARPVDFTDTDDLVRQLGA